ncbi:hypothetical protein OROGR_012082 [Orobanche gracilis]
MSKTDSLRREISEFFQKENEEFYECWERFNDLILKCPHHGFEIWHLVKYFYDGLIPNNRQLVQSMHGGKFLHLIGDEAWNALENLSINSQQWNSSDSRAKSMYTTPKKGGIYEVRQDVEIKFTIDDLVRKVDALVLKQSITSSNSKNEFCISCAESFHSSQSCPSGPQNQEIYNEEINALHSYGKSSDSPFAPTYNPNWRNHPNFSWKQNMPPMNQGGHQMNMSNQQNIRPNNILQIVTSILLQYLRNHLWKIRCNNSCNLLNKCSNQLSKLYNQTHNLFLSLKRKLVNLQQL